MAQLVGWLVRERLVPSRPERNVWRVALEGMAKWSAGLLAICPSGWSQVTVARDPFTLLASVLTLFIYAPSRVTMVCAMPGGLRLPPVEGYAPNAPLMPDTPGNP